MKQEKKKNNKRILNEKTPEHQGEKVKIAGWVDTVRAHGKIIFIDLRDRTGMVQVVFTPSFNNALEISKTLHPEWVVEIKGIVNKRPEKMVNFDIKTGKIEIEAEEITIFSKSKTLPFSVETSGTEINEELRLKYRYLDLRRKRLSFNIKKRHQTLQFLRNWLEKESFTEVETPILTKSTPEGARDFLVPSRFSAGEFYALPQSPQQYKQLLMVAGLEKYFQVARCFRDEDSRSNRQAEFTQLDIEMSFITQKEIMEIIEKLMIDTITDIFPEKIFYKKPFPIITHKEAMEKYGSDKPDIRKNKDDDNELAFLWVIDFPLFTKQTKEDFFYGVGKKLAPSHHMFTAPKKEDIKLLNKDPLKVKSYQYDLVLNGAEVGGGSIRIHNSKIQEKIFELIGFSQKQKKQFFHLLSAFEYGVPPHGGIAIGFDRFLSILLKENNIREVMAFPKTGESKDIMMNAPSEVDKNQLDELHIKTIKND